VPELRYDRLYRTAASESYLISDGERPLARLELHFAQTTVYGVLVFEREPAQQEIADLIGRVDEDLVWTAGVARNDFVVSVYVGRELGVFDDAARLGADADDASEGGAS
jgi:hypothetical protein